MPTANIRSYALYGINALPVEIEVHISPGLPAFNIVGMPETAVRESKERVRSAILNSNFEFPSRRITVNLAPADIPKQGGGFDLPIALGVLIATSQLPGDECDRYSFCAELSLVGQLRAIKGLLPIALASDKDHRALIHAKANLMELSILGDKLMYPAANLLEVCAQLKGITKLESLKLAIDNNSHPEKLNNTSKELDLNEVQGQSAGKKALEIAAAGGHNLIFKGPPGAGKSMLAKRISSILPELNYEQALEVASIYSISGQDRQDLTQVPVRSPHHTASSASLVGGGSPPAPGEVSLAHCGILFLDELPEFAPKVLEALREPLENGDITISRASHQSRFPAKFQLISAMNPCPCGYFGSNKCDCTPDRVARYQRRVSGPLLDRIDMQVQVELPENSVLLRSRGSETSRIETSAEVKARVIEARKRQISRQGKINAHLSITELEKYAPLNAESEQLLSIAMNRLSLSARGLHKVIRVGLTIADLEGKNFSAKHIKQSLSYR